MENVSLGSWWHGVDYKALKIEVLAAVLLLLLLLLVAGVVVVLVEVGVVEVKVKVEMEGQVQLLAPRRQRLLWARDCTRRPTSRHISSLSPRSYLTQRRREWLSQEWEWRPLRR
jgi:hypothetical protein